MKCSRCIMAYLEDTSLDAEAVQWAIDGAQTAVTTVKGESFCGQHLLEHIVDAALPAAHRRML